MKSTVNDFDTTYRVLDCFLGAENGDDFKEKVLVDKAIRNRFALF